MPVSKVLLLALVVLVLPSAAWPQTGTPIAASAPTAVPALVPYSGAVISSDGKTFAAESGVTFQIYKDEVGGEALWTESQTIAIDSTGHYKVQLGATSPNGLPADLFASGEARWLEVQVAGEAPQPRVLLVSVPYALKAADAATLGGLPPSAFALARPASEAGAALSPAITPNLTSNVTTTGGTAGYLAEFSGVSSIVDSPLFVTGANVGIGTITPISPLDVNGTVTATGLTMNGNSTFNGIALFPAQGTATAATGYPSQYFKMSTSAYNSSTKAVVTPRFLLQAEPVGNNTASPSATFNLLSSTTSAAPTQTGFYFNANGTINFAPGQTFPGVSTITGVTAGTGLTGGGTTGNVTLAVNPAIVPELSAANTFTGTSNTFNTSAFFNSDLRVDAEGLNRGSFTPGIRFGTGSTGEAISSDRTGTVNTNGIDIYTDFVPRLSVTNIGQVGIPAVSGSAQLIVTAPSESGNPAISATGGTKIIGQGDGGDGGDFTGGAIVNGSNTYAGIGGVGVRGTGGTGQSTDTGGSGGVFTGGTGFSLGGDGGDFYAGNGGNFGGFGIYAQGGTGGVGIAGTFSGNVNVTGTLTASVKNFRIDDPLDPANKYLVHASVESSEMMNIYSGNVTTDELGLATVKLPDWFDVENTDFRYQLTTIGRDAHAWIAQEVGNGQFQIATNATRVKVSWQITAVRQDAYAKANPLIVEPEKPANEKGRYIHPELYGQPAEKQTGWRGRPQPLHASVR